MEHAREHQTHKRCLVIVPLFILYLLYSKSWQTEEYGQLVCKECTVNFVSLIHDLIPLTDNLHTNHYAIWLHLFTLFPPSQPPSPTSS